MRVMVAGLGKLGSVMAGLLANAGHSVVGVDPNERTLLSLKKGRAPVDEPGLPELIAGLPVDQLTVTSDYVTAVDRSEIAVIVVPTPSQSDGTFDPSFVVDAVTAIGKRLEFRLGYTVIVCSTVSPGTMDQIIAPALEEASGHKIGEQVHLAYSPEFIALGSVIADMSAPDMVLVGANDPESKAAALELLTSYRNVDAVRVMSFVEAELTKLAINAYLSVKIGYANEIGRLAEALGADPYRVLQAIGTDQRIGTAYLRKGGPPTGPCLPRDLVALQAVGSNVGVPVDLTTGAQRAAWHVVDDIVEKCGFVTKVAILGVAYKAGSPVTDDSLARSLIRRFDTVGAKVHVHDPYARIPTDFVWAYQDHATIDEAIDDVSTVIIACPHPEYDGYDFGDRTVINPWG